MKWAKQCVITHFNPFKLFGFLHASNNTFSVFLIGQMVVAKVLSRLYAEMLLYGQSIAYYEHCVSVSRELKDKRLEGEYLEILSSLYLSLNTEK